MNNVVSLYYLSVYVDYLFTIKDKEKDMSFNQLCSYAAMATAMEFQV